jgi:SpoVK/Ycf46/Vps4 family AAA+-type ATPase
MADADAALVTGFVPESLTTADLRHEELHCPCSFCQRSHDSPRTQRFRPTFWDYADIAPPSRGGTELTDHQCLLCPPFARVFVFKTRSWEFVNMSNLSDPVFEETMMDSLILDERKRQTIVSLSKSFARRNKQDLEIPKPVWSPDFVAGKGTGLTFLLHGRPGVGKTLTAECVAALTKRPLMILTASDIGTNPEQVEKNLTEQFKLAQSWSAVLLIDQADVFMERRSTADLLRNSLVAGFLRALEYYQGILFLTTNRVGSFDDALISRIHVQLYYPEFTEAQRQMVWKTFIKKLEHDRKGYMRLDYAAKDYIRHSGMGSLKWNGREIRNAFQTAVSLAEYEAEKDEEGTILVTEDHLRAVVELSKDFKDYLNELHIVDEEKRAQNRFERVDNFREDRN